MSLVTFLTGQSTNTTKGVHFSFKDVIKDNPPPDFYIDATINENHQFESEPTENPVEEGIVVSDHIDLKPETLTLTGVMSDTPLESQKTSAIVAKAAAGFVVQQIAGPAAALALQSAGSIMALQADSPNRLKNSFDNMRDLQTKRIPFNVVTGLKLYKSMVITSLSITRDGKTGRSFNFTATLKQIRIVESKLSKIPNTARKVSGAGKEQDLGKKDTKELTKDNSTITLKVARAAKNGLLGLFGGGG